MVNRCLEGGGDRGLEEKIELLKAFLESANFGRLRSQSEAYLVIGKKVKFVICWREEQPYCQMVVVEGA